MDLGQIGAHCARCRTLDLLPLRCPTCREVFCRDHSSFVAHGCAEPVAASSASSSSTAVPLSAAGPCELAGCSKPRMVVFDLKEGATDVGRAVACPACAGFFCLAHRAAHACKHLPPSDAAAKAHTRSLISASFAPSPSSSSPSTSTAATSSRPTPPAAKRHKKTAAAAAVELMRLKQFAKPGRADVRERDQRWHLRVQLDLRVQGARTAGGREADKKLEGTYWRKDLTVGQIKQATLVKNNVAYNPVADNPSSYMHLVHVPPDGGPPAVLDSAAQISAVVEDGAWVVLVQGSSWQTP